jgi:hypothetical protein
MKIGTPAEVLRGGSRFVSTKIVYSAISGFSDENANNPNYIFSSNNR